MYTPCYNTNAPSQCVEPDVSIAAVRSGAGRVGVLYMIGVEGVIVVQG